MAGRTDVASRLVAAAPATVYAALLDARAVETWLPPEGMTGRIEAFETRPGGRFRMTLFYRHAADRHHGKSAAGADVVNGVFVELVPDARIVQRFAFEAEDPAFAGTMTMTWSVVAVEGGTEVTIRCDGVPDGIGTADHQTGMGSTLANLAAFLEGRAP